ncbi:MAG: TRAM domain-containing protein [Candidatus Hydrogenedentes bacterium]|nr:TRAM domain-containing protein [Candidatus Hydrogenedentota bacterium]
MSDQPNEHVVKITSVAHGGHGVCRIDGHVCFVAYGLPGDTARIQVRRQTKGVLWGEILEVEEASPDRLAVETRHFGACGGCSWLHFAYPAQAHWKRQIVRDALSRIGGIDTDPDWVEDGSLRLGYRTRAEFHGKSGRLGFYALGTNEIRTTDPCPLLHPTLAQALERLQELRADGPIEVTVNPEEARPLDAVMVWARRPPTQKVQDFFSIAGWSGKTGEAGYFMFDGAPVVNGAFSQASLLLNRMLVGRVRRTLGAPASLLDLYCGSGNFSLTLDTGVDVLGLDQNRDAIKAANRVRPGAYRVADESGFLLELEKPWEAVLLDPPRQGAKDIIEPLAASPAKRIVYVSCDPATLARDLKTLTAGGWRLAETAVVDMFPNTPHVETVCTLQRD